MARKSSPHPATTMPFSARAEDESLPTLTTYLLSLISIKRSNLCVSADVHTTQELLAVAEEVGDYICVLKTHADLVDDFSAKTIRGLREISERKQFLLFEDRKFGDIGNTVQAQYTRGPLQIATWAHLTNAHLLPGPSLIPALQIAAEEALISLNHSMETTISTGTPRTSLEDGSRDPIHFDITTTTSMSTEEAVAEPSSASSTNTPSGPPTPQPIFEHTRRRGREASATTTISQTFEPTSPRHPASLIHTLSMGEGEPTVKAKALEELGPPPHARGLLLLAQMSSEGNLATPQYTQACVDAARSYKDFVVGFIAQESLNQAKDDAFLSFAPGINLAPEGGKGDGKGQKWRGPSEVIGRDGIDIVIVGRGILGAEDRAKEARRYRDASWEAYETRIGRR
ncbi:orotidine 5'-phosphate decarboxylase [Lecanora helva]